MPPPSPPPLPNGHGPLAKRPAPQSTGKIVAPNADIGQLSASSVEYVPRERGGARCRQAHLPGEACPSNLGEGRVFLGAGEARRPETPGFPHFPRWTSCWTLDKRPSAISKVETEEKRRTPFSRLLPSGHDRRAFVQSPVSYPSSSEVCSTDAVKRAITRSG